jgi:hypothetical protein
MSHKFLKDGEVLKKLKIQPEVVDLVRNWTSASFYETDFELDYPYLDKDEKVAALHPKKAISFRHPGLSAGSTIAEMHPEIIEFGYQIFLSEANFGFEDDEITLFQSTDPYDILRMRGTNAINFELYTNDIIHKLKEWNHRLDFRIAAAGFDSVGIVLEDLPQDVEAFADEVYEFCPDTIDQGAGSKKELVKVIRTTRNLWMWWD